MLTTFNKYNLLLSLYIYILKYVINEINLLFFKCVQMFRHKSKGKGKKGESSLSSQACLGMSADFFAVMVLLNFYLHVLIHYYIIASHLIYFIVVFVCRALHLPTPTGHLSWGFAWRGLAGDDRSVVGMARGSRGSRGAEHQGQGSD
jgi:hypothetical protein